MVLGVGLSPRRELMGLEHGDTCVGTVPCHKSLQGRDTDPQALAGGHPSRTDAGGRGSRVQPLSLCSDQC